ALGRRTRRPGRPHRLVPRSSRRRHAGAGRRGRRRIRRLRPLRAVPPEGRLPLQRGELRLHRRALPPPRPGNRPARRTRRTRPHLRPRARHDRGDRVRQHRLHRPARAFRLRRGGPDARGGPQIRALARPDPVAADHPGRRRLTAPRPPTPRPPRRDQRNRRSATLWSRPQRVAVMSSTPGRNVVPVNDTRTARSARFDTTPVVVEDLGLIDYHAAWELQRTIAAERAEGAGSDRLLLLEHPSVFTAGRRTEEADLPIDGSPVVQVDRGGKITWHG